MSEQKIWRWAGIFGVIGIVFFVIELPLWVLPGIAPATTDPIAYSHYLASIRVIALTRLLLDLGMYVCFIVFTAGFRHLIIKTRAEYEWLATLMFGSALVWWAVTLVADSLQGAAVLDTLGGKTDPTAIRALVEGTFLIFNSSIAFVMTGVFMASAGYAVLATGALPKWIGWLACISAVLCVVGIPSMYADVIDPTGFYNAAGWGPAIFANIPPLLWFLVASIAMIRKHATVAPQQTRPAVKDEVLHSPTVS